MKKYFYLLLFLMFSSTCFAVNNASIYGDDYVNQFSKYYQQGLSGAYQYIDTHRDDEQWIDKGPELAKY